MNRLRKTNVLPFRYYCLRYGLNLKVVTILRTVLFIYKQFLSFSPSTRLTIIIPRKNNEVAEWYEYIFTVNPIFYPILS